MHCGGARPGVTPRGPLGAITKHSLRLAWQDVLHQHRLLLLLVVRVLACAAGAVLIAEPLVDDRRSLLIGPLAAVGSLLVLGLAAILIWVVVAIDGSLFDGCSMGPRVGEAAGAGASRKAPPATSPDPRLRW